MAKRRVRQLGSKESKSQATSGAAKGFAEYQSRASKTIHGQFTGQKGPIASMLGLASETGSILDSYKRYLRDSIDLSANREFLREELGDLLWYIAAVATACGLDMGSVAAANLRRTRRLYKRRTPDRAPNSERHNQQLNPPKGLTRSNITQDFSSYQKEASQTSQLNLRGPEGPIAPMLGLASATGSILDFPKRNSREINLRDNKQFFQKELGDLLWYLSAVATACDLDLGDIAEANLLRASDLYTVRNAVLPKLFKTLPNFDDVREPTECFPRKMVIGFEESVSIPGPPLATQTLIVAIPNAFPNGPIKRGEKAQGFEIGAPLGDSTTDNSRRPDGYRYHDALHMAFMAVLGWSPTMRALLRLKRKSKVDTDRDEDGARANYTEEGIAAILSRLARRHMGFLGENTVDGEVIAIAKALVQDLEVQCLPGWLWRRAISQGFQAMRELEINKGGYLTVDLDRRELVYTKVKPDDLQRDDARCAKSD
jgi:NTP pyrophosphatase (non-canonical NTP hydrolase)